MKFSPVDTMLEGKTFNDINLTHQKVNKPEKSGFGVENLRNELRFEQLLSRTLNNTPYRLSLVPFACRIASLRNKSLLDCVEQVEVVIFEFAEFDEVEARFGPLLNEQIDGDIADGGFNHDRHVD